MPCWPQGRRTSAVRLLSVLGGHLTYQARPGIAGELIAILQAGDPPTPHDFFVYKSPELGFLTPVEAVVGAARSRPPAKPAGCPR